MAKLKLSWDSVQGAASYNIYWATSPGVTTASANAFIGITNIFFYHTNLQENTTYYYIVVAVDEAGNLGPASVEFSAHSSAITSLVITPANANIGINSIQQYTALITYSDGYTNNVTIGTTWDTDNHTIATIDSSGLLTGLSIGNVNVLATYQTTNATTPLIVSHTLVSIDISPPNTSIVAFGTQQYTAIGHYNDLSTGDITSTVTWASSNTAAASISVSGLATGAGGGSTTISATLGLISASTSLYVTPVLQNLILNGVASNLSTSIGSGASSLAVLSTNGFPSSGILLIDSEEIFYNGISGNTFTGLTRGYNSTTAAGHTAGATVSQFVGTVNVVYPNTAQLSATGNFTDNSNHDLTSSVTWISADTSVATINSSGLVTTHLHGSSQITASISTIYGTITAHINVVVTNVLQSIAVTPSTLTMYYTGNTQQFTAIGTFNDGQVTDITSTSTWTSTVTSTITINSSGVATVVSTGSTIISATKNAITSNLVPVTVAAWATQANPGGLDNMTTIVGNSDGQIIVGGRGNGSVPVIWRWDGITWSTVLRGNVFASQNFVTAVHISLDGNTFFATNGKNIAKSTDGGVTWYQLTDAVISGGGGGVAAIDANTIYTYAGIYGTFNFYRSLDGGSTWASMSTGQTDIINDFFLLNANSIYAFGRNSAGTAGVIWHYNGSAWSKVTTSWTNGSTAPMQNVTCMWGDADNNMYAGGDVGSVVTPYALIRSTDLFTTFTAQSFGTSVTTVNGLDGYTGADNAHSVIYATASSISNFTVFKHQPGFDAANTFVNAGAIATINQAAQGIWVSPSLRAVAVGEITIQALGAYTPALTSLSITPTLSSTRAFQQFYATGTFSDNSVRDVTGSVTWHSSNTGAATIASGGLATSIADASTTNITATYGALTSNTAVMNTNIWIQQTSGTTNKLNGVFGFASNNIYAVGNSGTILHWNGIAWSTQTSGTTANLMGVQGPDTGHVYVWADDNHVYETHDGGTTWVQKAAVNSGMHGFFAASSTDAWATTNGSRLQHSGDDISTWSTDIGNIGSNGSQGVFGFAPNDMWMTRTGGTELTRYDGSGTLASNWHDWPNTTVATQINPGDTTVTLVSATYFPRVGTLTIDAGLGNAENITYTGKLGNTLTGCTRGGSFTHTVGAFVTGTLSIPGGFGTGVTGMWGTSDADLFLGGGFFNGAGIYYSTDRFATSIGIGPDNGFVPSVGSGINSVFGNANFVYATGLNQGNNFSIITYDRAKSQWTTSFDQNISNNSARGIWVDSSSGYTVAVGDGGTIVKKG